MSSSSSPDRTTTVTFQDRPKDMTKMGSAQTEVDTSSNANRNGHAAAEAPEAVSTTIFSLKGKVIIVTGGARGLGLTQAEALIEHGAIGIGPVPVPPFI
jgi:hypothetical protein